MRLIGIIVALAAIGYAMHVYLGSSRMEVQTKPAEYVDQAKQSADAISEAMKKQQEQMEKAYK